MTSYRLGQLLEFLKEDPDDAFTRFALAREHHKLGNIDEALAYYESLVENDPRYVGTYYHLGKLYEEVGRKDDAVDVYRKGIRVAETIRDFHALSELRDALMQAEGVKEDEGF
jgi:tetratricopeptide (TPR) repeat protein